MRGAEALNGLQFGSPPGDENWFDPKVVKSKNSHSTESGIIGYSCAGAGQGKIVLYCSGSRTFIFLAC